jgi:hypothetical protein
VNVGRWLARMSENALHIRLHKHRDHRFWVTFDRMDDGPGFLNRIADDVGLSFVRQLDAK